MGKSSKRSAEAVDAVAAPTSEMDVDVAVDAAAPKAKKSKKDDGESKEVKEIPKEAISAIAKPLAGKKLSKHVLKLVKKGELRFKL